MVGGDRLLNYTFLAVCGSLRKSSVNSEVLLAMSALSADDVMFIQYEALGELPQFNPDNDVEPPPPSVAQWRSQLESADAVIICSPEYAHGVPGALKNALDWVVGSGQFMHKPVGIINASASSVFVGPQLRETITVMMGEVVDDASVTLPLPGKKRDSLSMRLDREVADTMKAAMAALQAAVDAKRKEKASG